MYTLKAKLKTDFWFWKLHKDLGTLGEGLNQKKNHTRGGRSGQFDKNKNHSLKMPGRQISYLNKFWYLISCFRANS